VGSDVVPPGSGANAEVAVTSGLFDEQSDRPVLHLRSLYRGASWGESLLPAAVVPNESLQRNP
jgi:hypothetical protein